MNMKKLIVHLFMMEHLRRIISRLSEKSGRTDVKNVDIWKLQKIINNEDETGAGVGRI